MAKGTSGPYWRLGGNCVDPGWARAIMAEAEIHWQLKTEIGAREASRPAGGGEQ
jgi:hypothetical protein